MGIDFSAFRTSDVSAIGLQRTGHLFTLPAIGSPSFRLWKAGLPLLLNLEASLRREAILNGAMNDAQTQFDLICKYLGAKKIRKVVDIGCGHALVDLLFWRKFNCRLHLVDIENTEGKRHHQFSDTGAGYASLESAKAFLVTNGVPPDQIQTTNPQRAELQDVDVDLVVSLISAGFHYPVSTYTSFALEALNPGGAFIFDARQGQQSERALAGFSKVETVEVQAKFRKLSAIK